MEKNWIYLPDISNDIVTSPETKFQLIWKVDNMSYVKEGDTILELKRIDESNISYEVKANMSGLIFKFLLSDVEIHKTRWGDMLSTKDVHNVAACAVLNTEQEFIESFFENKPNVGTDDFSKEKAIRWEYVGKPSLRILDSYFAFSFKDIWNEQVFKSTLFGYSPVEPRNLEFSLFLNLLLLFEKGTCYIEFEYNIDKVKIQKGDSISLLLENGDIIDFPIQNRPYKKGEKSKERYIKCPIYAEHVEMLQREKVEKWRITFNNGERPPQSGMLSKYFSRSHGPYVALLFQYYLRDFLQVLHKEIPEYSLPHKSKTPLAPSGSFQFDGCHVYLMKDMANGYYKIGISNKPEYREHTLQSEKPTIELLCSKKYPTRQIAEAIESALHATFGGKRIRGEWFMLDEYDVAALFETLK